VAEKEKGVEITPIDRVLITTYPKLGEAHKVVLFTYVAEGLPPRTVTLDLTAMFGDKAGEAIAQIEAQEGPLWEEYLRAEKGAVRKDLERVRARRFKPYRV